MQATLLKHEQAGTLSDPAYEEATAVYYQRHLCRIDPLPECVARSFQKLAEWPEVYETMWGPNEFNASGTLKDWDITQRLGEIRVPALVLGGRFDEATPAITETVHRGIAGSECVIFEHSAHLPHVEETERYMQVLGDFLNRVEAEGKG